MMENFNFNSNEILEKFKSRKKSTGKGGLLAPLIKQLTDDCTRSRGRISYS